MPIRTFEAQVGTDKQTGWALAARHARVVFVREMRLLQDTRLSALEGTRLGVEGHNWLRQLMHNTRDGDSVAMDGPAPGLEAAIVAELEFFRAQGITPVFVFSGLAVQRKDARWFGKDDHRPAYRNAAWEAYWAGNAEQAQRGWATASPHAQGDMVPFVMRVLQAHGGECMRAPYSSWAQLAYLYRHETQAVHAVYASLDVLMFDVDRVVTQVNAGRGTFTWVQREQLLAQCAIGGEQLVDACILAGCDWCPTFPPLVGDLGFSFRAAVDTVAAYRTGFNAVQMLGEAVAPSYSDTFLRALCTVRYHVVLQADGSVAPLNAEQAPSDLHDIIGYRLPTAAYRLLARGAVHPPVLNMLAAGVWPEFPPADNGEAAEYRGLVGGWQCALYRRQCAALCEALGPFFRQRKVAMQTWFQPQADHVLHESKPPAKGAARPRPLEVRAGPAADAVRAPAAALERCGDLVAPPKKGAAAAAANANAAAAAAPVAAVALLSTLRDLGFVAGSGERTAAGSALQAGLRALGKAASPAMQWAVVAGAVLLGQGLLTAERWSVSYDDEHAPVGGGGGSSQQQRHVRVLARVAALVPQCRRSGGWRLALSRDVLAFNSAVRLVHKAMGHAVETAGLIHAVAAATSANGGGGGGGQAEALVELLRDAPMECATGCAAALLVRALLAEHAAPAGAEGCWARVLEQAAGCVVAPALAVRDAVALVDAMLAVAASPGGGAAEGVAADLRAARDWAQPAFAEALK
ncbi:hypothetical protein LPJ53_000448 [Coemansia erecta]|uniref:PIN domain-like protein n=1 Tax=Coemansia erecta TaxID=147472 RepID=A0A9W8CT76_9FUNG|nr:hypothetical protein LPJ53_000448 [Coemansia erecta]